MNIDFTAMDKQVIRAFNNLVNQASNSILLGKIAMNPNGCHEKTIEKLFRNSLSSQFGKQLTIPSK